MGSKGKAFPRAGVSKGNESDDTFCSDVEEKKGTSNKKGLAGSEKVQFYKIRSKIMRYVKETFEDEEEAGSLTKEEITNMKAQLEAFSDPALKWEIAHVKRAISQIEETWSDSEESEEEAEIAKEPAQTAAIAEDTEMAAEDDDNYLIPIDHALRSFNRMTLRKNTAIPQAPGVENHCLNSPMDTQTDRLNTPRVEAATQSVPDPGTSQEAGNSKFAPPNPEKSSPELFSPMDVDEETPPKGNTDNEAPDERLATLNKYIEETLRDFKNSPLPSRQVLDCFESLFDECIPNLMRKIVEKSSEEVPVIRLSGKKAMDKGKGEATKIDLFAEIQEDSFVSAEDLQASGPSSTSNRSTTEPQVEEECEKREITAEEINKYAKDCREFHARLKVSRKSKKH